MYPSKVERFVFNYMLPTMIGMLTMVIIIAIPIFAYVVWHKVFVCG